MQITGAGLAAAVQKCTFLRVGDAVVRGVCLPAAYMGASLPARYPQSAGGLSSQHCSPSPTLSGPVSEGHISRASSEADPETGRLIAFGASFQWRNWPHHFSDDRPQRRRLPTHLTIAPVERAKFKRCQQKSSRIWMTLSGSWTSWEVGRQTKMQ